MSATLSVQSLSSVSGLPITFDLEQEKLEYDQDQVRCNCSKEIPLAELIHSLLNKSLKYPEVVYSQHCSMYHRQDETIWSEDNFNYDVVCLPAGLLGIEYNKTHVFHVNMDLAEAACVVEVHQGVLTVILQKNRPNNDPFDITVAVEQALMLDIHPGEKVVIPSGYYYNFVNTRDTSVVFARLIAKEHVVNYQALKRQNGLAYYLISKNARREIVSNPKYRGNVDLKKIKVSELADKYPKLPKQSESGSTISTLYQDFKKHVPQFASLLL